MSEKKNNKNKWIELAVILIGLTIGILHACFDAKNPFLPKTKSEQAAEELQKKAEELQKDWEKKTEDLKKIDTSMINKIEP